MFANPFLGLIVGALLTAVIQSSSATSVMVVGFVNSGMMKVTQAIGIVCMPIIRIENPSMISPILWYIAFLRTILKMMPTIATTADERSGGVAEGE